MTKQSYDSLIEHWCFLAPHTEGVLIGRFHLLSDEDTLADLKQKHREAHKK